MKKKLVFKKCTITNLSNTELKKAHGGAETDYPPPSVEKCPTEFGPLCGWSGLCPTIDDETLSPEQCPTDTCYQTDYTYCHTGCNC